LPASPAYENGARVNEEAWPRNENGGGENGAVKSGGEGCRRSWRHPWPGEGNGIESGENNGGVSAGGGGVALAKTAAWGRRIWRLM
jgi:hypothetical protein